MLILLYNLPDDQKIPDKLLTLLSEDFAMKNLLKNKRLQEILKNLEKMNFRKRMSMIGTYLQNEPIFREYADACLDFIGAEKS